MRATHATVLINTVTGQYPLSVFDVFRDHPEITFSAEPNIESLKELGYEMVEMTAAPEGDVVTQGPAELVDGKYHQTWVSRPYTEQELQNHLQSEKAELRQLLDQAFVTARNNGFAVGELHIQYREIDQLNLLMLKQKAVEQVTLGVQQPIRVRTLENQFIEFEPADYISTYEQIMAWGAAKLQQYWDLKDAILSAQTTAELPDRSSLVL